MITIGPTGACQCSEIPVDTRMSLSEKPLLSNTLLNSSNVFNEHNHSLGNINCTPGAAASLTNATSCIYDNGSFSFSDLRVSTGFSLHWQAPVGPIVINIGRPIRSKPGDIGETLQFNFGSTF